MKGMCAFCVELQLLLLQIGKEILDGGSFWLLRWMTPYSRVAEYPVPGCISLCENIHNAPPTYHGQLKNMGDV